jgi:hypothetical protein
MTKMDRAAAARIQSSACKSNNGTTPKGSFAARATSAAYKNEPLTNNSSNSSNSNLLRACGLFAVTAAATGLVGAGYYFYQYLNNSKYI